MPTTVTTPDDLDPLERRLAALEDRVSALEGGAPPPPPPPPSEMRTLTFRTIDRDVPGPCRGIHGWHREWAPPAAPVQKPPGGTVLRRYYSLRPYMDSPLPDSFLDGLRAELESARAAGVTFVIRFAYSYPGHLSPSDTDVNRSLAHIEQLGPILSDYLDVILCIQLGTIGQFGEWHHSDHWGSDEQATFIGTVREQCIRAWLRAVPEALFAVRRPAYIRLTSLTADERSRIGIYDDAYCADQHDMGTWPWWNDPAAIEADREWQADHLARFRAPMYAETNVDPQFAPDARVMDVLDDAALFGLSILNPSYHEKYIAELERRGMWEPLVKHLGYRLVLTGGQITAAPRVGGSIEIALDLTNEGFAAPIRKYDLEIVLWARGTIRSHPIPGDGQWTPGDHQIRAVVPAPDEPGTYSIALVARDRLTSDVAYELTFASGGNGMLVSDLVVST